MSTPLEQVYAALSGAASVTAIVSTRITPMKRGQADPLPALTYQDVSTVPVASLDGDVSNLDNLRVQVDCWAASLKEVQVLAAAVRAAMGAMACKPTLLILLDDYDDRLDPPVYRRILDYSLWLAP